jgi:ferric-dicitrate binding protein FerR (iron transport regulator)
MFTVEELLSDQTFTDYCLNNESVHRDMWKRIISSNPGHAETFREAKALLSILSPSVSQNEIEIEVNKLRAVFSTNAPEEAHQEVRNKKRIKPVLVYSSILLACLSVAAYFLVPHSNNTAPIVSTFKTHMGERKQYILPDGSTVILNSNSSFYFDKSFGRKYRRIHLDGDAFFKVAKNAAKPFTVITEGFSTTALGTAFYVHGNADSDNYGVDLLEGKVRLEKNTSGEAVFLTAGQKASLTKTNKKFITRQYDTLSLNKWVNGILTFKNTPINEALYELENWYSVKIEDRRSSPKLITINGDYVNVPLEDILKIICFSLSCTYHFENNSIIIQ